ncbi:hypothetical protein ACN4EK_01595 [Pantanalinema rosaneae CENA516]
MKRQPMTVQPPTRTTWIPFITKVLAFIGLWQVLSNSITLLNRWF